MSHAAVLDRPATSSDPVPNTGLLDRRWSASVTYEPEATGHFVLSFSCLAGRTKTGEPLELTPVERLELVRGIQRVINGFWQERLGLLPITKPFWLERPNTDQRFPRSNTALFRAKIGDTYSTGRTEIIEALLKRFEAQDITMTVIWQSDLEERGEPDDAS